ncbi:major type 1 subunit fimbrin [Enterobacterales bacterium]|nr:major type 1 subunit fimbrin [Enterobacterales bacterium]
MNFKLKSMTAALLAFSAFSASAFAVPTPPAAGDIDTVVAGGTVHFTGEIVNAACAVSPDSDDQTVKLGQVRAAELQTEGTTARPTPFNIVLVDCDTTVSTAAAVTFYGPATTEGTALSVSSISTENAAATNVGIQILDSTGQIVLPNSDVAGAASLLVDGRNTIPFTARFLSLGAATPGAADADATFNVTYS